MNDDNSAVTKKLAAYIAGALKRPLPREVAERGKLHLLDTLAAIVSGSRLLPGKCAIGYVKTLGGTKEATVAGTKIVTTAVNAALANGIFAHADETDDSHRASITHPGAGAVPAALAMAERNHASGTALLRAVVLGYDVGTRLTMSLDLKAFYARGHHPPSFGQLFGAAAAAGALARLDPERVRYLLSYTAQQAAGLSSLFRDPAHISIANDRTMPDINLQHMVAVMLLDGNVTFKSSHDFARLNDPRTAKLRKRVELLGSPDLANDPTDWNAHVEIRLRDGRRLAHHTPAARGGHANPMTREEEDAKALDLLAPVLGGKRARSLIEMVWKVEKLKDARELGKLLRA